MTSYPVAIARVVGSGWLLCLLALPGCAWQSYTVTRGVREFTGAPTRVHVIAPVSTSLRSYRIIEVHELDNMLPGRVPAQIERGLNSALDRQLRELPSSPRIVHPDPAMTSEQSVEPAAPGVPTLVVDGAIDDFDQGYAWLRLAELGFNHMVATVRIRLSDKRTGRTLGAVSVTAQDDRVTATSGRTIRRLAARIGRFVGTGYAR